MKDESGSQAFIWIVIGLAIVIWAIHEGGKANPASTPQVTPQVTEPTFDDLLDAIEWVESKGDSNAVGDGGEAVGSFQIWEIYVDDCNRISHGKTFYYIDRYSRKESREMVTIYLKHYGGTFEEMARKHNGGPQGHKKESTKAYWEKIKDRLNRKG